MVMLLCIGWMVELPERPSELEPNEIFGDGEMELYIGTKGKMCDTYGESLLPLSRNENINVAKISSCK
jgi:hypothetical protein